MPLPKKTKIIIALVAFVVLAALIGGSVYFKNKKAAAQKIGAEETDTTDTEQDKMVCLDCDKEEEEEPTPGAQPIEPLDITPKEESSENV